MARRLGLPEWTAAEFEALLAPPEGGAPEEPDAKARAAAEAPVALVLFDRGTEDDVRLAGAVADVAAAHAGRLRAGRVAAATVQERLAKWQAARRAYDTFDFQRWPAVGVLREGRLVTTFHPRRVFFPDPLQEREEREQLEIFLAKMVFFDPARVKEQKSLQMEARG
jgi:hypothetical protein